MKMAEIVGERTTPGLCGYFTLLWGLPLLRTTVRLLAGSGHSCCCVHSLSARLLAWTVVFAMANVNNADLGNEVHDQRRRKTGAGGGEVERRMGRVGGEEEEEQSEEEVKEEEKVAAAREEEEEREERQLQKKKAAHKRSVTVALNDMV